jgi:hypothetical protein
VPKVISMPVVHSAQTVHLSCAEIRTISKQVKMSLSFDPRHLGVQSGASKKISEPMVRLVQTVHLHGIEINTISK